MDNALLPALKRPMTTEEDNNVSELVPNEVVDQDISPKIVRRARESDLYCKSALHSSTVTEQLCESDKLAHHFSPCNHTAVEDPDWDEMPELIRDVDTTKEGDSGERGSVRSRGPADSKQVPAPINTEISSMTSNAAVADGEPFSALQANLHQTSNGSPQNRTNQIVQQSRMSEPVQDKDAIEGTGDDGHPSDQSLGSANDTQEPAPTDDEIPSLALDAATAAYRTQLRNMPKEHVKQMSAEQHKRNWERMAASLVPLQAQLAQQPQTAPESKMETWVNPEDHQELLRAADDQNAGSAGPLSRQAEGSSDSVEESGLGTSETMHVGDSAHITKRFGKAKQGTENQLGSAEEKKAGHLPSTKTSTGEVQAMKDQVGEQKSTSSSNSAYVKTPSMSDDYISQESLNGAVEAIQGNCGRPIDKSNTHPLKPHGGSQGTLVASYEKNGSAVTAAKEGMVTDTEKGDVFGNFSRKVEVDETEQPNKVGDKVKEMGWIERFRRLFFG